MAERKLDNHRNSQNFIKGKQKKKYRRMIAEYYALLDSYGNLGWITLDKPRKNGFKKYYVLQDHARNSNIKNRLQKLLKFTEEVYCHNRDFKYTRNSIFGNHRKGDPIDIKKVYHRVSNESVFNGVSLDDFPSEFRKYLYIEKTYTWNNYYYEVTIDPKYIKQYFREKISINWITKIRETDSILDSKRDKLSDYLYNNQIWEKVNHPYKSGWDRADTEKYMQLKYEWIDEI